MMNLTFISKYIITLENSKEENEKVHDLKTKVNITT